MTPTAVTPAGGATKGKRGSGHRSSGAQTARSRGGYRGRRAASRAPVTASAPAPQPVRRRARRPVTATTRRSLGRRAAAFLAGLPDHPWLDRIVRGRYWIPILGALLAGIVAMQVEVLKLSANIGRAIERGTSLQSRNEQLRASCRHPQRRPADRAPRSGDGDGDARPVGDRFPAGQSRKRHPPSDGEHPSARRVGVHLVAARDRHAGGRRGGRELGRPERRPRARQRRRARRASRQSPGRRRPRSRPRSRRAPAGPQRRAVARRDPWSPWIAGSAGSS